MQASWEKRLIDRVYNVYKGEKRKHTDQEEASSSVPSRKRPKILERYPPLNASSIDEGTVERHRKALDLELQKERPRMNVILELMELTFSHRREYVLNEASSVEEIVEKYPAFGKPDVVRKIYCKIDVEIMFINAPLLLVT